MALFQAGRRADQFAQYTQKLNNEVMGNQFGLLDDARKSASGYLTAGRDAMGRAYTDGVKSLEAGNGQAGTINSWIPGLYERLGQMNTDAQGYDWQGRTAQSRGAYLDALGQNGADGRTRAMQNFQTGPGYQWQVDQTTDAAARNAAKLGMANSGNAMSAVATLGSNLANQEWGNHVGRLGGLDQLDAGIASQFSQGNANRAAQMAGLSAAGQAAGYGRMADAAYGYGRDQANLGTQYGQNMNASLTGEAGLDLGVAGQKNAIWNNFLTNNLKAGEASVAASNADDAGALGLGMGIANLGMQALGGFSGGAGGISGLFGNLFKKAA